MPSKLPAHPRSWGDTSPLLLPARSLHTMHNTTDTTSPINQRENKLPHDASVFVGSLPSNIDQMDLTRMLMEHLSEHTQIKNIKVVRDSKGGVCAFVQCENAASATALIQSLHSSVPKPFLGRILRYEPARAFRTLLVSYRTPTQIARHAKVSDSSDKPNAEIELELPDAMRIWKQRHSRFHSILYNSEAIQAQENSHLDDSFVADNVVFLHPLAFDAEMLKTMASYFGRLESFVPLEALKNDAADQTSDDDNSVVDHALYPAPHNAPRSPCMDNKCWEIKWDHRDDCVSALMTLRRVPHLTVTWAHQPVSSDHYQASGCALYPLHIQDCSISVHQSPVFPTSISDSDNNLKINVVHQPLRRHIEYNAFQGGVSGFLQNLNTSGSSHEARELPTARPDTGHSSLFGTDKTRHTLNVPNHLSETSKADSDSDGEEQELFMPQTPALDTSSITPITPGSQFPITPTSCDDALHQSTRPKVLEEKENSMINNRSDRELDPTTLFVGGLEMFGPGAWNEEKVKNFFARFGGLESVKVVRPLNSCAAFAFVKFNNVESPARAVSEEHNRVYEGRAMRVQLRDCNPPRSPWKHIRGRGRPQQTHAGIQRRLNYKLPYDGQDQNIRDRTPFKSPETNDGNEIQLSSLVLSRSQKQSNVDMALSSGTIPSSSPDLASNASTTPQTENYREWYDELESPAHTPAPSSLGSSISTTGASFPASPYPYPNRQFFPTPWMHPFMQQPPYPVPYYGSYPIYPGGGQNPTQSLTSPPASDTNGPPMVPHWPHMSMYGSYIPYPVLPPRTHDTDPGQLQQNTQAPLVPTGFIQNEQGTLVAVYQPEALDQYLARTQGTAPPATPSINIGMQRWIPYTAHQYESDGSVASFPHATQAMNQGQMRGLPPLPAVRPQQFSDFQRSYPPFRAGDGTPNNSSRRYGGRREPQVPFTPTRNNPRLFGGRTFRPPLMQNSGQVYPPEMRQQSSSSAPISADWKSR